MEENNNNQNSFNTEELKNETVNTAKQVKETMKNVNIKEETMAARNTLVAMFKDPIGTVEGVAEDKENKFFKTSLFLIIVWAAVKLISIFISGWKTADIYNEDLGWIFKECIFKLSTLWSILAPALIVLVFSIIVFVLNKNNKKSIPEVISVITVAYLPVVLNSIISLLNYLSSDMSKITGAVGTILTTVKTVLLYFGIKTLFKEDDDKKFIKSFIIIVAIYQVVAFILTFMKIYI